jgi:intein/homing endonuclease
MGVKPVFKLTTESGRTIKTTGNHPYLAIKQQGVQSSKFKELILII